MTGLSAVSWPAMLPSTYDDQHCSIARALEVVGERWTLLILRDAFLGVRRFDDLRASLGMSRTVLTRRLDDLVEAGLLRREPYQERPVRHDYLPTQAALDLWPALVGLGGWGTRHAADGPHPREFFHEACGTTVRAAVRCPHCDVDVPAQEAGSRPGPGYDGRRKLPDGLADALARPRPLLEPVR
jgi:DNA-binding HxlR family transcriptional regulator